MEKENQENPCCQRDLMMIEMNYVACYITYTLRKVTGVEWPDLYLEEARSWSADSKYRDGKGHWIKFDKLSEITYTVALSYMSSIRKTCPWEDWKILQRWHEKSWNWDSLSLSLSLSFSPPSLVAAAAAHDEETFPFCSSEFHRKSMFKR